MKVSWTILLLIWGVAIKGIFVCVLCFPLKQIYNLLIFSHMTSLSLNWRDKDLKSDYSVDKELTGWLQSERCSQELYAQVEASDK